MTLGMISSRTALALILLGVVQGCQDSGPSNTTSPMASAVPQTASPEAPPVAAAARSRQPDKPPGDANDRPTEDTAVLSAASCKSLRDTVSIPPLSEKAALGLFLDVNGERHFNADGKVPPVPADTQPILFGYTNLPDGTELMLSISSGDRYTAQDDATVSGGCFVSGSFSDHGGGLSAGTYKASVLMPIPAVQPESVQAVIGENGENLHGPKSLIHKSDLGITMEQTVRFVVRGSEGGAPAATASTLSLKDARALLVELRDLERAGREMGDLREVDDLPNGPLKLDKLRRCGERMRELQAKARELRRKADDLPDSVLDLRTAAAHLELCVSCAPSLATQNCDDVRSALRTGSTSLARAQW